MGEMRQVEVGTLRLSPNRPEGADLHKLSAQIREFGADFQTMPPLLVTSCADGELCINDGMTRAARAYLHDPEILVTVEIIADEPTAWVGYLRTVAEAAEED